MKFNAKKTLTTGIVLQGVSYAAGSIMLTIPGVNVAVAAGCAACAAGIVIGDVMTKAGAVMTAGEYIKETMDNKKFKSESTEYVKSNINLNLSSYQFYQTYKLVINIANKCSLTIDEKEKLADFSYASNSDGIFIEVSEESGELIFCRNIQPKFENYEIVADQMRTLLQVISDLIDNDKFSNKICSYTNYSDTYLESFIQSL